MQGSSDVFSSIMLGGLAVLFAAGGVGLLCLARLVARDREASSRRQSEWLPLDEKWFGVGCGLGFGLTCLALSVICLYLVFIGVFAKYR